MRKILLLFLTISSIVLAASYTTNVFFTFEGGVGFLMTNRSGISLPKGSVVCISSNYPKSFDLYTGGTNQIGVTYNTNVSNGGIGLVIFMGIVDVLLESNTSCTQGNWVYATTNGRVNASLKDPTNGYDSVEVKTGIGRCLVTTNSVGNNNVLIFVHIVR